MFSVAEFSPHLKWSRGDGSKQYTHAASSNKLEQELVKTKLSLALISRHVADAQTGRTNVATSERVNPEKVRQRQGKKVQTGQGRERKRENRNSGSLCRWPGSTPEHSLPSDRLAPKLLALLWREESNEALRGGETRHGAARGRLWRARDRHPLHSSPPLRPTSPAEVIQFREHTLGRWGVRVSILGRQNLQSVETRANARYQKVIGCRHDSNQLLYCFEMSRHQVQTN